MLLLAGPELVKAETPTVDLEGSGDHLPVWPFAAHPIVEAGTIERSSLHFAEAVEYLLRAKGQLGLEPFNEVGFNASGKTEKVNESPLCASGSRLLQNLRDFVFVESGNDGGDGKTDLDPGGRKITHGGKSGLWSRSLGLECPGHLPIQKRDCKVDGCARHAGQLRQKLEITTDKGRLGDNPNRIPEFEADLETSSSQFITGLKRNVWIRSEGEDQDITLPALLHELMTEEDWGVDLGDDLSLEVGAGAKSKVFVGRAGEAVGAGVRAAAVAVDGVVEGNIRTVVAGDDRPGGRLFENYRCGFGGLSDPLVSGCQPGIGWVVDVFHRVKRCLLILVLLPVLSAGAEAQSPQVVPPIERQRFVLTPVGSDWSSPLIPVRIGRSAPFLAAGHSWQQESVGAFTLRVRLSADGVAWGDWMRVEVDHDTIDAGSAGGLIFIDAQARYLQYHLLGEAGQIPARVDVDLINPGRTPDELQDFHRRSITADRAGDLPFLTGSAPRPPVVSRTDWGCPDGQGTSRPPVSYTTVTHLIVHHTVSNNNSADWAAVVRSIWNFHFYDRGYIDIGYNYLIDPNGVIYEGRSGGDNVLGAHFSGVNGGTMGVALLGTFTGSNPAPAAMDSLRKLLAWKAGQRNLRPYLAAPHATSGMTLQIISGHRDGPGATECPGEALYDLLPRLRADVHNQMVGASYVTTVSAASYVVGPVAPDSIASAFGLNLATGSDSASDHPLPERLAGAAVRIVDRLNREYVVPLFHASPGQLNLHLPAGLANGPATILVENGSGGQVAAGSLRIDSVAPGIFTANSDGLGVPAALLLRQRADGSETYEPVSRFDAAAGRHLNLGISFGPPSEQLFLVLFGTGIRRLSSPESISVVVGDQNLSVTYAGPTRLFTGLDQVNLLLPPSLAGRGALPVRITVDRRISNQVLLLF